MRRLDPSATRKAAARSAGTGPSIGFTLPGGDGGVEIGLGVRLGSGGWEDLAGEVVVNRDALSKPCGPSTTTPVCWLPIAGSLPKGWSLDSIRLGVNPAARRFELSATAKGPQNTGGDAKIGFEGQLTFDGVVRVQVFAANLAVLQSVAGGGCGGQSTVSAFGELELTPARQYNPSNPSAGPLFPIADVRVTGSVDCYAPTDGMTVKGEVTWDSAEGLSIAGTLTADLPAGRKISADVAGAYKGATNWSLSASLASDEGVRIGDLLTLERLEGGISRTGNGGSSALSVKLTGGVRDIKPSLGVTVNNAAATLTNSQCNFAGPLARSVRARSAATDEHALCLTVDAGLEFRIPGATNPVKVTGGLAIDLRTLRFSVAGSVTSDAPFGPEDFHLTDVTLFATNASSASQACGEATATAAGSGRLSFGFTAKGRILGVALNRVAGAYLADGNYCLAADVGAANLPSPRSNDAIEPVGAPARPGCSASDAPALQQLVASYSSKDRRASLDGRFCLPRALRERLGTVAEGAGDLHLKIATTNNRLTLDGSAGYTLPNDGYWLLGAAANSGGASPDPSKAALALKSFSVSVKLGASSVGLGFTAAAKLRLPKPTGSFGDAPEAKKPTEANIAIGANASLGDDPSFTVYTTLQGSGGAGCTNDTRDPRVAIPNLFGQAGLNVCALGLSGTLSKTPSVAAAASFALPASWGRDLGVSNASYSLGFSVSAAPCVDLSIDRIDTKNPAIDLYNRGAIVANKLHLVIAPTGCTLPSGLNGAGKEITPGFRMDFDGALFGTPVQLSSAITLSGPSFGVEAHLNVGTANRPFKLGPVEFDQTTFDLVVKPAQEQYKFHIDTGARFGSAEFKLNADFEVSGTGTSRTVKLGGSAKIKFELLKAKFDGDMRFSFSSSPAGSSPPTQETTGRFSGHFALDLLLFNAVVDFDTVEYDSTRGGLQVLKVRGGTSTSQSIGSWAQLSANGSVDYTRASNRVHVSMGARVKLWNAIDLQPSLEFDIGPVSIPLRFGPGREVNWTYPPLNAGIKINGAITVTLKWSPNDGFGIDVDSDFRVQACLGACVTLAGIRVDKRTGAMTLTVVGVDIEIRAGVYSGRENAPPSYSGRRGPLISQLGKCLDAPSAADQTRLKTADCTESPTNRVFAPSETGELRMRGKCIDAGNGAVNDRVRIQTCHGGDNQRWHRDGLGRVIGINGLCFDVVDGRTAAGVEIQMLGCKDHPAQRFAMSGELRPGRTVDACLDTERGNVQLGTELRLQRCDAQDQYQIWISGANGSLSSVTRVQNLPFACIGAAAVRAGERIRFVNCNAPERLLFAGPRNGFLQVQGSQLCMFSDGAVASPVTLQACTTDPDARWSFGGYG